MNKDEDKPDQNEVKIHMENAKLILFSIKPIVIFLLLIMIIHSADAKEFNPPKEAPDFTLKALINGEKQENLNLREQRGKVVLVNFWATWCGPCRAEMPLLNDLYLKYKNLGFTIFGINVEDDPSKAKEFLEKTPLDFPILFDTENQVSEAYELEAMPSTFIIDKDGKMRVFHPGYKEGYEKMYEQVVKKLIRE